MSSTSTQLRDALLAEHSKQQTVQITEWIGSNRKRFAALVAIICGSEQGIPAQRGAWVIIHCAEANPEVVVPYLKDLLENLKRPELHDAIKRNTMKVMALLPIPDDLAGLAFDLALRFLTDEGEAVAARAYSMTVLQKICEREPTLADEVFLTIEAHLPHKKKPAFQSRAKQVLKQLVAIHDSARASR